jgi:hypothetical protein
MTEKCFTIVFRTRAFLNGGFATEFQIVRTDLMKVIKTDGHFHLLFDWFGISRMATEY